MNPGKKHLWLALLNGLALVLVLVFNYLATALPLAGRTPKDISDMYPTLFTPAGFTFAIWGIIYLGLIGVVIAQAFPRSQPVREKLGWWFILSCLTNVGWLLAWHNNLIGPAFLIILTFSLSLGVIYLRLRNGDGPVTSVERWLVRPVFSIYLGWLTIATVANASILLVRWQWSGWGLSPEIWTGIVILLAVLAGAYFAWVRGDGFYPIVIMWALYGIYQARMGEGTPAANQVAQVASLGIIVLAVGLLRPILRALRPAGNR
ncbi:MAG: tryptophan-rich sensory protein [Lewinellaceae bacterium]|nr:tryptophan-rich sensory protein [Lewinellaceae bacterium]